MRVLPFACCLALAACGVAGQVRADEDAAGPSVWSRHGLVPLGQRLWVLPRELELREKLAELPRRRERLLAAEKEIDAAIQANLRTWQETRPALAALEQSLGRLATGDPQRPVLERQIAPLKAAAVDPARLGGQPEMVRRLSELSLARCELSAAIAWVRQTVPQLRTSYAQLAAEPEIAAALSQTGNRRRLGPSRSYQADLGRMREFESLAATSWVPIFQQSGQTRFTALLDEKSPVTFTWTDSTDQPLVLTASAAEAAGLVIPADAPRQSVAAAPGRTVTARQIALGSVRLGKCVLPDAEAYILPPEAEDIGNRMGRRALIDHRLRLAPQQLRLWIDAD